MYADLTAYVDWQNALNHVDVVVHSAARVHVMAESAADPVAEFRRVNVEASLNLARQAAKAVLQIHQGGAHLGQGGHSGGIHAGCFGANGFRHIRAIEQPATGDPIRIIEAVTAGAGFLAAGFFAAAFFALAVGLGLAAGFGVAVAALGFSAFGTAAIKSAKLSSIHSRKKAMSGMIARSQMIEKAMRPL